MRDNLAEKLEVIGGMFEIDGMSYLLSKFDKDMNPVKFNAVVIQLESLLLKENQKLADKIIAMSNGIEEKEVAKMEDADYAAALRKAIMTDVIGFFASSPRTDGKK